MNAPTAVDDRHIFQPDLPRRAPATAAMLLAALLFAAMGFCTKAVQAGIRPVPASEVAAVRFAFGALVMLPLHGRRGIDLVGHDRVGLAWRGIWGGISVLCYFLSLHYTSIANAQLLNFTSLIFAPLFAAIWLHERVGRRGFIGVCGALAGIVIVTTRGLAGPTVGDLFGLASGIMAGAAITAIRRLRQTEASLAIFFYLCLVGLPIAAIACLLQPPILPEMAGWLLLLGMGVSSVGGQILMTYGYRYVRAAEGGVIMLSQVVYSLVIGVVYFREPLTAHTLVGGALILASSLWLTCAPRQTFGAGRVSEQKEVRR